MKRFITIFGGCILSGYLLLLVASVITTCGNFPRLKKACVQAQRFAGTGTLFGEPSLMRSNSTHYRFYENKKWQQWNVLEAPQFEAYIRNADFAALKHARMDAAIAKGVYKTIQQQGFETAEGSEGYANFVNHLLYAHHQGIRPDSVQVIYYRVPKSSQTTEVILTFKAGL